MCGFWIVVSLVWPSRQFHDYIYNLTMTETAWDFIVCLGWDEKIDTTHVVELKQLTCHIFYINNGSLQCGRVTCDEKFRPTAAPVTYTQHVNVFQLIVLVHSCMLTSVSRSRCQVPWHIYHTEMRNTHLICNHDEIGRLTAQQEKGVINRKIGKLLRKLRVITSLLPFTRWFSNTTHTFLVHETVVFGEQVHRVSLILEQICRCCVHRLVV